MDTKKKLPRPKLQHGDINLETVYRLSKLWYQTFDDKKRRMKLDIKGAKITARFHMAYDPSSHTWKQVEGLRHTKLIFLVTSVPISYESIDTIPIHKYQCVFLFYDINLMWKSPFRWRCGGLKKPVFSKKGDDLKKRIQIANQNIKNGTQMQAFLQTEYVSNLNQTLYGPCRAVRPPLKANPALWLFFSKQDLACIETVIRHLFTKKGISLVLNKVHKIE